METTINNVTYRADKLHVRTQYHLMLKLGPVLARMQDLPALFELTKQAGMDDADKSKLIMHGLTKVVDAIAELPRETADMIFDQCLQACHRKDEASGKFTPLMSSSGVVMFPLELPEVLQLMRLALQENFGNFFDLLPGVFG